MDRKKQQSKIFLVGVILLLLPCCVGIYFCGATAERWLPRIAVSLIHPKEPWPLADRYVWKNDLDHAIAAAPVVADGQVYVKTNNGLAAINLQTGVSKWERFFDINHSSNLAAGGGFVAVGSPNGVLVLRGDTGEEVWHYESPFAFPVSLIIAQDRLYATFAFEEVCAFDLPGGELLWRSREPNKQHRLPHLVLAGSHLIVSQSGGRVYALDIQSGQTEWESHLDDVLFEPALVDTNHFVINGNKAIYSISTTDGQVQWQTPSKGKATGAPLVVGTQVFWASRIEAQSTSLQSADVQSGKPIWTVNTGAEIISHPLASDGHTLWVRVSYPRPLLLLYDVVTGQQLARKSFSAPIYQPFEGIGPVVDNGKLYLISGNRIAVYGIQP
jgi:outer membrane protein assembly factor BamB